MLASNQGFTYNKFEKPNDWPRIDGTFDYKIENDKLLSGNEHIYLCGPVTYTKVGNLSIKDNIVSGFTGSDYLKTNQSVDLSKISEIVLKIKVRDNSISQQFALCASSTTTTIMLRIFKTSIFITYGNSNIYFISNYSLNTDYWIKFTNDGSTQKGYYSTDGINYTLSQSENDSLSGEADIYFGIPSWGGDSAALKGCDIDLNESYIKVNDQLWFYGKNYTTSNMVPVPAGLEYNNTVTPSIGWVNTNTNKIEGPIDYTIVGSPTITNGVVSGFSNSNYVSVPAITFNGNDFESVTHYSYEENATIYRIPILGLFRTTKWQVFFNNSGNLRFYVGGTQYTPSLNGKNFTYIKLKKTGSDLIISQSNDGISWENETTYQNLSWPSDSVSNHLGKCGTNETVEASIDLNETYIKINGQAWFGKCPSEFQQFISVPEGTMIGKDETEMLKAETYQEKGIVDYTITGNLTIQNDVVSNFSSSNYLTLPNWTDEGQNLEFCLSFLLPEPYVPGSRPMNQISSGGTWSSYFSIDSYQGGLSYRIKSGESLSIVYSLQNETKYIAKLVRQSGTYTLYLLDEQENILATSTSLQTSTLIGDGYSSLMRIGYESSVYGNEFPGKIYLDKTYIKIDNVYLFKPYPNSYPKLVGPVSYTIVGNTTVTNGVARGFDSDNYIEVDTTNFLNLNTITDLEAVYVLDNCGQGNLGSSAVSYFAFRTWVGFTNSGNLVFELNTKKTGESEYIRRDVFDYSYLINTDGKIWLKFTKVNRTFKLQYSLDGNSYSDGVSYTLEDGEEVQVGGISEMILRNARTQQGGIYLAETYIKINGSLWFGKEDWKPCIYTDNAIYLLGSHSADYSNYNQLSFTPSIETESDEAGSYNVWIDNQKVIENKTGNTLIEWDKLALTTGYSVTTPSSLKVHPIKIEPTNSTDSIIAFNTETIEESDESI